MRMIQLKKKTSTSLIKLIVILVPFFFPGGLTILPGLQNINYVFHSLKIVSILLFLITEKNSLRIHGNQDIYILTILYGFGIAASNILHNQNILALRTFVFYPFLLLICMQYLLEKQIIFINAVFFITGAYNLVQIITVIMYYPNGMNHYIGYYWKQTLAGAQYFLGGKNQAIFYIILFLLVSVIRENLIKEKMSKKIYIYFVIFGMELYYLDSANSIICLLIFVVFYTLCVMKVEKRFPFLFCSNIYIVFSIAVFVMVCLLAATDKLAFLKPILGLLGRDSTFTNRSYIWEAAITTFKNSPIIGAGEIELYILRDSTNQAHNMYLDVLYKYGVLGFLPYFFMIIRSGIRLDKGNNTFIGAICIGVFFIMMLHNCFDIMDNYVFICYLALFYNTSRFNSILHNRFKSRRITSL